MGTVGLGLGLGLGLGIGLGLGLGLARPSLGTAMDRDGNGVLDEPLVGLPSRYS